MAWNTNFIGDTYALTNSEFSERRVLGLLLKEKNAIIQAELNRDLFVNKFNRSVYALLEKYSGDIDRAILIGKLKDLFDFDIEDKLQKVENDAAISDKAFDENALELKSLKTRRDLLLMSQDIYNKVLGKESVENIEEYCRNKLSDTYSISKDVLRTSEDILQEMEDNILDDRTVIKSGYSDLDFILKGFYDKTVTILAGRSSMGKSALALNITSNIAKAGHKALYISAEMDATRLMHRLISMETGYEINDLAKKDFYLEHKDEIDIAKEWIKKSGLMLHSNTTKLLDVVGLIKRIKLRDGLDFVCLDYLQKFDYSVGSRSRENEVSQMSNIVYNRIAKDVGIPVLLLSQLNRDTESNKDKKPTMANLRESGSLENDADTVILLHRPDYYSDEDRGAKEQETQVIVAKGRNTGVGECKLMYHPYMTKFSNFSLLPI